MKKESKGGTALAPSPVVLLSVKGKETPNIITLSWAANICSDPPSIAVGIRPNRHSYDMVKEAGEFVINIPGVDQLEGTKFCGTKSGRDYDKFAECNFTPVQASKVDAPMIEDCPICLECKTSQIVSVGTHDLFIAEVLAVHIDESVLDDNGRVDIAKAKLFTYMPLNGQYWSIGEKL
ncbi:MAG: flavin reductase family protein [Candidatus Thorarchaeota archaeon]|jgi:flavin reductase (DIM6/NTAB) family NADH-FMN oxidoreductase RutF